MSITALQQNLKAKGHDPGAIDGKLGAKTYRAMAAFLSDGKAPANTGDLLAARLKDADINTRLRLIHFFAQVAHESGFRPINESLNYDPAGLKKTFGLHRISEAQCKALGRAPGRKADQVGIANTVYGGAWGKANLGNTEPGDGYRYRGRGLIQLTGRTNYTVTGPEYASDPDLVVTPEGSARAAVDYWRTRKVNAAADADNVTAVTRLVNGGTKGLKDRQQKTARLKAIWPA